MWQRDGGSGRIGVVPWNGGFQYLCGSSCSTCKVNDCEGLLLLFGCEKQKAFVEFGELFFSFLQYLSLSKVKTASEQFPSPYLAPEPPFFSLLDSY